MPQSVFYKIFKLINVTKMMGKIASMCVMTICIFSLVNASILEKPQWKKGDYWQYAMKTLGGEKEEILSITILGRENITVGNITYRCIVVKSSGVKEEVYYYDEENLTIIKKILYNDEGYKEIIYESPQPSLIQYPIFVGKKWNITIDYENNSVTLFMECIGIEKISTRAGTFNCYTIRADYIFNETSSSPYVYQIIYVSSSVGNVVKTEMYGNNALVGYTELISFHYSGYVEEQNYTIVLVIAIAFIFILTLVLYKIKK